MALLLCHSWTFCGSVSLQNWELNPGFWHTLCKCSINWAATPAGLSLGSYDLTFLKGLLLVASHGWLLACPSCISLRLAWFFKSGVSWMVSHTECGVWLFHGCTGGCCMSSSLTYHWAPLLKIISCPRSYGDNGYAHCGSVLALCIHRSCNRVSSACHKKHTWGWNGRGNPQN